MPIDLNGNKIYNSSIGPTGEVIKSIVTDRLTMHLDAGNKNSYNTTRIITGAKIYSTYAGLRSANYTVQYSDDNSNWTTAFTGVMSNNSSCGFQTGSGVGLSSVGAHRYWRYVEGSAVVSHHPRTSRIILIDSGGAEHTIARYTDDNCSDSGDYIIGTVSYDFTSKWNDLSNYGYSGTFTNGPTFNSNNGGYISFDGVDDYVTMGTATDFATYTNGFTIDLWTYPTSAAALSSIFSSAWGTSGTQWQVYVWYNTSSQFGTTQRYSGTQNDFNTSNVFAINNWYNVVVTSNNTTCYIYVNGTSQVSNATGQINNQDSTREVRLGGFKNYTPVQYPGRIASCRIYNRALSASEVLQHYNVQKSRFGL